MGADWFIQRREAKSFIELRAQNLWGHSHSTSVSVSQNNKFNQANGREGHWTHVPVAEASLLTA